MARQAAFDLSQIVPSPGAPKYLEGKGIVGTVLVPRSLAGGYAVAVDGDCMAPAVLDEDTLIFHPGVCPAQGMIVGVYFHDCRQCSLKRLVSAFPESARQYDAEPTVLLEMDNPRTKFCVARRTIDRLHVLVGVVRAGAYLPIIANPFGGESGRC